MGYACPVCEIPQRDGEHLANHLAFTAMLRGGAHADWLDERVPDWGETDPDTLADRVTPHADETAYDEVFEDTTADHDHPEPPASTDSGLLGGRGSPGSEGGTPDDVLREARSLTRRMYENDSAENEEGDNRKDGATNATDAAGMNAAEVTEDATETADEEADTTSDEPDDETTADGES